MTEEDAVVTLTITPNIDPFVAAMRRAVATFDALSPEIQRILIAQGQMNAHYARHQREHPPRSAMHARYDLRRRARRRRNRA